MGVNKNAQIRYKALDSCFSNTYKRFYINDLIEHCSQVLSNHYAKETTVSRRQIIDDIDFMKSEAGFDALNESQKDKIEEAFGNPLEWERLSDKRMSRIKFELTNVSVFNEEDWSKMFNFMVQYVPKFQTLFKKPIQLLNIK